jgi:hypothetical protein
MEHNTSLKRHRALPGRRPGGMGRRMGMGALGLLLLAAVAGCGGNRAACDECRITVDSDDVTWTFQISAGGAATADTQLSPSAPILFIVYGPDGLTPIPGADITLFTSGTADVLVSPADRATVQAVDGGNNDGNGNLVADFIDNIAYLQSIGWTDLDFSIPLNLANPDVIRRGIYPTRTDDHGQVEVWPAGWLPGCPAIAVGGQDVVMNGELGVSATIADDFNIWTAEWTLTCKAP